MEHLYPTKRDLLNQCSGAETPVSISLSTLYLLQLAKQCGRLPMWIRHYISQAKQDLGVLQKTRAYADYGRDRASAKLDRKPAILLGQQNSTVKLSNWVELNTGGIGKGPGYRFGEPNA